MYILQTETLIFHILELGRDDEAAYLSSGDYVKANKIFFARNQLLCALTKGVNYMLGELDRMLIPMVNASTRITEPFTHNLLLGFKEMLFTCYEIR